VSAVSVFIFISVLIEIVILFSSDTSFLSFSSFSVSSADHTDNNNNNNNNDNDDDNDTAAVQQLMKELFSQNQ